jgi:hypothetical protein
MRREANKTQRWIGEGCVQLSAGLPADSFSPREKARMRGKSTCLISNRFIFQLRVHQRQTEFHLSFN